MGCAPLEVGTGERPGAVLARGSLAPFALTAEAAAREDGQSAASHDGLVAGAEVVAGIADDRLGPEAATARASACPPSPKPLISAPGRRATRSMRRLRPIKLALRGTPSAVLALLLIAGVAALFLLFVNWLDSWVPGIVSLPTRFWLGLT